MPHCYPPSGNVAAAAAAAAAGQMESLCGTSPSARPTHPAAAPTPRAGRTVQMTAPVLTAIAKADPADDD
eukprot:CAMPEP_0179994076 /NCGR_PEP_ID=MMETSP0984-20121128/6367_1 /TAXON_ID=483367 /ORGANISM="non described non described, Strain CCMP 2436" /LENGTH=69 /DNA_ID=CAMNT_0021913493 /DNA_START=306 /DNA_END=513 /DNA_ORIENTATION=+